MRTIRAATVNDIPAIRQLASDTWPNAYGHILSAEQIAYMLELFYSTESLQQQMLAQHVSFLLLEDDNKPVGFASFAAKAGDEKIYHLHKLYVLDEMQGTGAGKALLQAVAAQCSDSGASRLRLNVNRHNKALHFYIKQGFAIAGQEDIDIGNGYFMNDFIMEKELASPAI